MPPLQTIYQLDLGPEAWFDLWHVHARWEGDEEPEWKEREPLLHELFSGYQLLAERLQHFPKAFQLWLYLDAPQGHNDAIYLHSPNPNRNNFSLPFHDRKLIEPPADQLGDFMKRTGLKIMDGAAGTKHYFLFDPQIGIPLL
jgi:hypothetical protein